MIAAAVVVSYCALVSFHHSDARRAGETLISRMGADRLRFLKWTGWGLIATSLLLCLLSTGIARGISIWLGLIGVCAVASLAIATLRPQWHILSPVWVLGIVILFSTGRVLF